MNYELDSTLYNGKHLQSKIDWESTNSVNSDRPTYLYASWLKLFCCRIKIICDIQFT